MTGPRATSHVARHAAHGVDAARSRAAPAPPRACAPTAVGRSRATWWNQSSSRLGPGLGGGRTAHAAAGGTGRHGVAAAGGAVEADAGRVGPVVVDRGPVGPPPAADPGPRPVVVVPGHQVVQPERRHVVDGRLARAEHHLRDGEHRGVVAERHADPLVGDRRRGRGGDPRPSGRRRTSWRVRSSSRTSCGRCRCWRRRDAVSDGRTATARACRRRGPPRTAAPGTRGASPNPDTPA